ncbi:MAG: DUF3231 family protein [Peptococcaceae bacterium]
MKLTDFFGTTTTTSQQTKIHSGEAFALWQHLVQRYDIYELTDIFENFANDFEFRSILGLGTKTLNDEITKIEIELNKYGIPLPPRPPKSINTPSNTEILRDELMFRIVFMGIQNFVSQQTQSMLQMQHPDLVIMFDKFIRNEISITNKLSAYGRLKGWLFIPPSYNPTS